MSIKRNPLVVLAFFGIFCTGCYSIDTIDRESIPNNPDLRIVRVVTLQDSVITFQEHNDTFAVIQDSVIAGVAADVLSTPKRTANGDLIISRTAIPVSRVRCIDVQRLDPTLTIVFGVAVIGVAAAVIIAGIGPIHAGIQ